MELAVQCMPFFLCKYGTHRELAGLCHISAKTR